MEKGLFFRYVFTYTPPVWLQNKTKGNLVSSTPTPAEHAVALWLRCSTWALSSGGVVRPHGKEVSSLNHTLGSKAKGSGAIRPGAIWWVHNVSPPQAIHPIRCRVRAGWVPTGSGSAQQRHHDCRHLRAWEIVGSRMLFYHCTTTNISPGVGLEMCRECVGLRRPLDSVWYYLPGGDFTVGTDKQSVAVVEQHGARW